MSDTTNIAGYSAYKSLQITDCIVQCVETGFFKVHFVYALARVAQYSFTSDFYFIISTIFKTVMTILFTFRRIADKCVNGNSLL